MSSNKKSGSFDFSSPFEIPVQNDCLKMLKPYEKRSYTVVINNKHTPLKTFKNMILTQKITIPKGKKRQYFMTFQHKDDSNIKTKASFGEGTDNEITMEAISIDQATNDKEKKCVQTVLMHKQVPLDVERMIFGCGKKKHRRTKKRNKHNRRRSKFTRSKKS
jgi:tRNA G10  N-methylase Trm11